MGHRKTQKVAKTITLPLVPLRDVVVFPHMIVPLFVGREKSISVT
jgi:ATP-dependent Lon protease